MAEEQRRHKRIGALAGDQFGVVSHRQLRELGLATSSIAHEVASGRLHRVHRGAYSVGHPFLSEHGRAQAALLACGRDARLSHFSAGWLWGLIGEAPRTHDVTTSARGHRRSGVRIHHSTILCEEDRATRDGLPTTSLARTLLDVGASRTRSLGGIIERADRMGILDLGAINSLLARCGGHRGRGTLRKATELYRGPEFVRSIAERRFLKLVEEAGLPRPSMNFFVAGHELDAYWETERFAVEVDGWGTHRTRAAFERDPVRIEDLKLAGIDAIRFTARRIEREPAVVGRRLRTLLTRRRAELGLT